MPNLPRRSSARWVGKKNRGDALMAKMRVYELADNLDIPIPRAVELLREVGAEPANHMSVVERVPARRVRQLLKHNKNAAVPQARSSAVTAAHAAEKKVDAPQTKREETKAVEEAPVPTTAAPKQSPADPTDVVKVAESTSTPRQAKASVEAPKRQPADRPAAGARNGVRSDVK